MVSIHAPAGGATRGVILTLNPQHCFNPRARGGRDMTFGGIQYLAQRFNPRARGGRDPR